MIRAMWRLRLLGKLDRASYARYKSMIFSGLPIAGAGADEHTRPRLVVQHLRAEVEKRMERTAGGPLDEWLLNITFDGVVTWIVEHWQEIVRVLAALMVFLQAELEE